MKKGGKKEGDGRWLLALIVFIAVGGVLFSIIYFRADPFADAFENDRVINTLFVLENDGKPASAFLLMFYQKTRRAAAIEIPGDVGLILKRLDRVDRLDAVYRSSATADYVAEVGTLLGVTVRYTLVWKAENLAKMVDMIDGVNLFIPQTVREFGDVPVLFPSGFTNLDGDKAVQYLLYEDAEESIEALHVRQQRFFLAFLKRIAEKIAVLRQKNVDKIAAAFVETNLSDDDRSRLFTELARLDWERVTIQQIAGSYRDVSGQRLLFPHYDGALIKEIVRQTLSTLTREVESTAAGRVLTVAVLNGTETAGLAARTAQLVAGFGYDVILVGNADRSDYEKTEVIDHLGDEEDSKLFADIIRCSNIRTEIRPPRDETTPLVTTQDYELEPNITLIIGRDFNGRYTGR